MDDQGMNIDVAPTFLHCSLLVSFTGPVMPNETPLNHHQVKMMVNKRIPNEIAFDFVENRLEEKMKWSRRCESIRTAK
jgi:hypothetical protein